jgi:hypothetical protein
MALDHTRHLCGVLPGPPVAMEFFGEVGEDEVADVLARDGREFEELRDDAGEVQVGLGVAVHVGQVLEKLEGKNLGVHALFGEMFAGCVSWIFCRGVLVCGHW